MGDEKTRELVKEQGCEDEEADEGRRVVGMRN